MIKVAKDVVYRCVADEHMLIPVGADSVGVNGLFILTESGARTWELLTQEHSEKEICDILANEYDAPYDTIANDVHELLTKLREAGLISDC